MWVKRTEEEIAAAKRRGRIGQIRGALFMSAVIGSLTTFFRGGGRSGRPFSIVPMEEVPDHLPLSLFFAVIASLVYYRFLGNSGRNMVCPKCDKVKGKDSQTQCSCGGYFEDAETMKWV